MDWIEKAKVVFTQPKPAHFTNYHHCDECAEHDQTLISYDVDTIGMAQLGSPAWDPLCFSSTAGLKYYLPAMIRLTLETLETEVYLDQLLFHLISDGKENNWVASCSPEQRAFVTDFLSYLLENHAPAVEEAMCADQLLEAYDIWTSD